MRYNPGFLRKAGELGLDNWSRIIVTLMLVVLMAIFIPISLREEEQSDNNRREASGFISDCSNDTLEITTDDGNIWLMTGMYVESGTTVRVVFDTMGTGDITDDEIVELTLVL